MRLAASPGEVHYWQASRRQAARRFFVWSGTILVKSWSEEVVSGVSSVSRCTSEHHSLARLDDEACPKAGDK